MNDSGVGGGRFVKGMCMRGCMRGCMCGCRVGARCPCACMWQRKSFLSIADKRAWYGEERRRAKGVIYSDCVQSSTE